MGGVCLNVGCIPSKALLHIAKVLDESHELANVGVNLGKPELDPSKMVAFKNKVIGKLTGGLKALSSRRKVDVIEGIAQFTGPHELSINKDGDITTLEFEHAIIAVGSESVSLPFILKIPEFLLLLAL